MIFLAECVIITYTDHTNNKADEGRGEMGFFGDLVNGLVGGFSEITQCTKFLACFSNLGAYEGMDVTEQSALILNALDNCGAATTPDTLLGEIYPLVVKAVNEDAENLSQPVAHETCPAKCAYDRNICGECLKARLEILEALNYAEHPEEYRRNFNAAEQTPSSGDDAEGASGVSARFVPSSTMSPEQQAYELIYNHKQKDLDFAYSPERKKVTINIACATGWIANPTMPKAMLLKLTEESINEDLRLLKAKMSLSDLYFAADHYHMSVPTYLRGLFEGNPNLKTAAVLRKEQQEEREREIGQETRERLDREREITQQQRERDRQLREETRAKLKQIEQEKHNRKLEMIKNNPPQYGGVVTSRTCADCTYYSPGARKCAYKDRATNAGDSCGFFKWK